MSSPIWTPAALSSEIRSYSGRCWRLVEAQHRVATLKLVDTLAEQETLERLIEGAKPSLPSSSAGLHYLLSTPFRYGSYGGGSRFRRAGRTPGVFYASERIEVAVAEIAFHRLLFFAESPDTRWPESMADYTAFSISAATAMALDLMKPHLSRDRATWTHPVEIAPCQALAETARAGNVDVIRYESVRDPLRRANIAVLACSAFARPAPLSWRNWRLRFGGFGVQAICDHPMLRLEFGRMAFAADARISALNWER